MMDPQGDADRLEDVVDQLDRLERLTGRAVNAREVADALGWSSTHLAEEMLDTAVELGCVVIDGPGRRFRVG